MDRIQFKVKQALLGAIVLLLPGLLQVFAKAPQLTQKNKLEPPPRIIRTCCSFGANMGFIGIPFAKKTDITSPEIIGPHEYLGGKDENNGNIYTKRGGFIDLGHLRDCADWTVFIFNLINASKENPEFVISHLGNEGGQKTLVLRIPEEFNKNETIELAGKIAYDLSVWHEISTWFGASYIPMLPERYSSFSPEDLYSNLLGVYLGKQAIKSNLEYNEAMTLLINEMLFKLEAVSTKDETYAAMMKVNNIWYTNEKRLPSKKVLIKRYLVTRSDLIPWLVSGEKSILPPFILIKPEDSLSDLYQLNIKLNFKFPVKSIFHEESDRVITQKDFNSIIKYIESELIELEKNKQEKLNNAKKRKENVMENKNIRKGQKNSQ